MHINWSLLAEFVSGATFTAIIAHAVNTFPTPVNKYGVWFLGVIQFVVGQRTIANNTLQGLQTDAIGVDSRIGKINLKDIGK